MKRLLLFFFFAAAIQAYRIYFYNRCSTDVLIALKKNDIIGVVTIFWNTSSTQYALADERFACVWFAESDPQFQAVMTIAPGPLLPPLLQLTTDYSLSNGVGSYVTQIKPRCLLDLCPTLTCSSDGCVGGITNDHGKTRNATILSKPDFDVTLCANV